MRRLRDHPLVQTLFYTKGNARACMWTEPLWGIPFNLYAPYASKYMEYLGLSDVQIGIVATIYILSQMFWAVMGGSLTDKFGRRKTTLYFDMLGWTIPMIIWACARSFPWFVAAALFNGIWRVTENSWGMLLVEESPPESVVKLYAVVSIAGQISSFFAPIAFFFVQRYDVVPTMRVLYLITGVMMSAKFIIMYYMSHETAIGKRRMAECVDKSVFSHLAGSRRLFVDMLHDRRIMLTIALAACVTAMGNVNGTFWPLLVTDRLGIKVENLSIFSMIKSAMMLVIYLTLVPRLSSSRPKIPLSVALAMWCAMQLLLIVMPRNSYAMVIVCLALEALSLSMLNPLVYSLQFLSIAPERRSQTMALFVGLMLMVTSPFGAIAGALSELNRVYPFALGMVLAALAYLTSRALWKHTQRVEGTQVLAE